MFMSTAITCNPKILVALNGKHLFVTQLHGSAGALLHISSQGSRLMEPVSFAAILAVIAGKREKASAWK